MAQSFAAMVDDWAKQSELRLMAVFRRAVELLGEELSLGRHNGGKLPYVTGNLSRSILAELNQIVQEAEGPFNSPGDIGAKTALAQMGDFIHIGFQAGYARRRNYGFVGTRADGTTWNEEGAHFVEYAASVWPVLVELAAQEIRAMSQV